MYYSTLSIEYCVERIFKTMNKLSYSLRRLSLCDMAIVWVKNRESMNILRIFLSKNRDSVCKNIKKLFPRAKQRQDKKISFIAKKIRFYSKGKHTHFNSALLKKSTPPGFQLVVYRAISQIPYGRVITYKNLARIIGTKSFRAVGNALAKNPFPIIIPCHRVVSSNRRIGGFQSGENLKKDLLRLEGITFDRKGRILEKFFLK